MATPHHHHHHHLLPEYAPTIWPRLTEATPPIAPK
jgi:hypothetical protein